jgi:hypothetical protein
VTRAAYPSGHARSWSEVTLVFRHGQTGSGSASCTRDLQVMSLTKYCSSIPRKTGASRSARTFVSSSSGKRLRCLSYRGEIGTPGRDRTGTPKHGVLGPRVSAYSTTGVWCGSSDLHRETTGFKPARSANSLQIREWCQAPDSHREAVRFELTRYANSHQLGGTRGQTRTDSWRFRKSPPFPSARV